MAVDLLLFRDLCEFTELCHLDVLLGGGPCDGRRHLGLPRGKCGAPSTGNEVVATQIFLEFSPRNLGKISDLTSIFFKCVGSTTN